ncbi:SDR family oxidoreductase [Deinococcus hopiensis]|uniref:Uncharacterized conserved protein YbjT, contains NAD(P)-binding and DUF2867 domains n=1 Tax=Deinococcus hopiensis KR-140 TaxID=695939 RepID=A0A1W1USD0_9DEIO|nr:NmrA family NAD(P)-binding protein [Deinococcus hopiensis]SMB84012.1 Uncharacterized conserved protein YbjT, contains NAD(P)-binding and DUF2867 domains [Deinococcus hopiensis KR-140]
MTISNVLVLGATGAQGEPVARYLLASGRAVRVLARTPEKARALAKLGAQVVRGDLDDPASLDDALRGVDGLFFIVPFAAAPHDALRYGSHVIDAAKRANVKLVVWNPTGDVPEHDTGNPAIDVRRLLLARLQERGLPYIALQPTGYFENFLGPWTRSEVVERNTFAYPFPTGVFTQLMAIDDVAVFATSAFNHPEIAPAALKLAGPEHLNIEGIAERFSRALQRSIHWRSMSPREFGDRVEAVFPGAGDATAQAYEGAFTQPERFSTDIDVNAALAVLPVQLTSLESWVRTHANLFEPLSVSTP